MKNARTMHTPDPSNELGMVTRHHIIHSKLLTKKCDIMWRWKTNCTCNISSQISGASFGSSGHEFSSNSRSHLPFQLQKPTGISTIRDTHNGNDICFGTLDKSPRKFVGVHQNKFLYWLKPLDIGNRNPTHIGHRERNTKLFQDPNLMLLPLPPTIL